MLRWAFFLFCTAGAAFALEYGDLAGKAAEFVRIIKGTSLALAVFALVLAWSIAPRSVRPKRPSRNAEGSGQ